MIYKIAYETVAQKSGLTLPKSLGLNIFNAGE